MALVSIVRQGANADGRTFVGTSNITVSDAAVVNTIFVGGRRDQIANAKFSVNGSEAQLWDGKAALAIGDYELTYDADKKTITLANA